MGIAFSEIKFGFASAEEEANQEPSLLKTGAFDPFDAFKAARPREAVFLFLGPKGAGKSAVAQKSLIEAADESELFVSIVDLAEVPYSLINKIIPGDEEPESKISQVWEWIGLNAVVQSLGQDHGLVDPKGVIQDAVQSLKEMQLDNSVPLSSVIRRASKKKFQLTIPKVMKVEWGGKEKVSPSEIPNLNELMKNSFEGISTKSKHIVFFDGLDHIINKRQDQISALSLLVEKMAKLNRTFSSNSLPAKINILMRDDLFVKIGGANKNKIRQDNSKFLDWTYRGEEYDKSYLFSLLNARASSQSNLPIDVVEDYFPNQMSGSDIYKYILDYTRHRPRDFLRLMHFIQIVSIEKGEKGELARSTINQGVEKYSKEYFVNEILDELDGNGISTEIILRILGSMESRFTVESFMNEAVERGVSADDASVILDILFDVGAIGMIGSTHPPKFTFKFRNPHATLPRDVSTKLLLHRGLLKAIG